MPLWADLGLRPMRSEVSTSSGAESSSLSDQHSSVRSTSSSEGEGCTSSSVEMSLEGSPGESEFSADLSDGQRQRHRQQQT